MLTVSYDRIKCLTMHWQTNLHPKGPCTNIKIVLIKIVWCIKWSYFFRVNSSILKWRTPWYSKGSRGDGEWIIYTFGSGELEAAKVEIISPDEYIFKEHARQDQGFLSPALRCSIVLSNILRGQQRQLSAMLIKFGPGKPVMTQGIAAGSQQG